MKSVIFTTFFTILLQESHQNFIWKVVTSFNVNPPLKLFFYSLILTNNNLLLKIYCENIVVAFLFFFFFSFLNYIHTFLSLLFFFLLDFSPPHMYPTHIFIYPSFSFSSSFRISLSPALSLKLSIFLLFLFLLDFRTLSSSDKKQRKNKRLLAPLLIEGHRQAQNRCSLCQAAPSAPPPLVFFPNVAQMG